MEEEISKGQWRGTVPPFESQLRVVLSCKFLGQKLT